MTELSGRIRGGRGVRREGSALFVSLLILGLLVGLSFACSAVAQKNIRQANVHFSRSALGRYAESGIEMALYDLRYDVSGNAGNFGTTGWLRELHDIGKDGIAGSMDGGEADGIPTPGEPEVNPVSIGSRDIGASLLVFVEETRFPGVRRIVSTATNGLADVTVEAYVRKMPADLPVTASLVGAAFPDDYSRLYYEESQ